MLPQEVATSNKHQLYKSLEHIVSPVPEKKNKTKKLLFYTSCSCNLCHLLQINTATTANASCCLGIAVAASCSRQHTAARGHIQPQSPSDHDASDLIHGIIVTDANARHHHPDDDRG